MGRKRIKIRVKDTEKADQILSKPLRLAWWVRSNLPFVIAFVAVMILVSFTSWGWGIYKRSKEERALREYNQLLSRLGSDSGKGKILTELVDLTKRYRGTKIAILACLDIARMSFDRGDYLNAGKWYKETGKKLENIDPLAIISEYYAALSYEMAGRLSEALECLRSIEKEFPADMRRELYWNIAAAYEGMGKYREALKQYSKALEARGMYPLQAVIEDKCYEIKARLG